MAAAAIQQPLNNVNIERHYTNIYISPTIVHRMFNFIMGFQPFENHCLNQNVCERMLGADNVGEILMSNQEYIWHLYIRYLSCSGRTNLMFEMLDRIVEFYRDVYNNVNRFELFLNRVDVPGFEGTTILDTVILWNNDNDDTIQQLYRMGATTHITLRNIINVIHRREWINPFTNIMHIPGFPNFHRNNLIRQPEILEVVERGVIIHQHARAVRHISHFYETIISLLRYDNDNVHQDNINNVNNEQQILNELIINNPDINNHHVQNNHVVIAE